MPFPNPDTQFKPGQSGNPSGRKKQPDIEALNRLIEEKGAESKIALTWLATALGSIEKGIAPNSQLFKMLIEYRNGKVPDQVNVNDGSDEDKKPPYEIPALDERYRPKGGKRRGKAKKAPPGGDVSP